MPTLTRNRKARAVIEANANAIEALMALLGNEGVRIDIACHRAEAQPELGSALELTQLIDRLYRVVNNAGKRRSIVADRKFHFLDVINQAPAFRRLVNWALSYYVTSDKTSENLSVNFDADVFDRLREVVDAAMLLFKQGGSE